jgi:hypothetical protein
VRLICGNGGAAASWFSEIAHECAPGPQGRLSGARGRIRTDDLPITSRTLTFQLDPPSTVLAAQVRDRFHLMPSCGVWYQRLGCHRGCHPCCGSPASLPRSSISSIRLRSDAHSRVTQSAGGAAGRLAEHRLPEVRDPKITAPVRSSERVGQRPAAGRIVPAGTAITALIDGRGGEPLNQADAEAPGPGHRPRRGHDLGIGSVGKGEAAGRQGRSRAATPRGRPAPLPRDRARLAA